MSIVETLKKFSSNIKNLMNKSVSKNYITNESNTTIDALNDSIEMINRLQSNTKVYTDLCNTIRKDKQYMSFYKKLHGVAAQDEVKGVFNSFKTIALVYITEMESLIKYVTFNKEADNLTDVKDVKYSQATFIGLIEQAIIIERFIKAFLFKGLHFNKLDEFKKDLPWMYKLIDKEMEFVANQINTYVNSYNPKKSTITERIINFFKSNGYDPNIVVENSNVNHAAIFDENVEINKCGLLGMPFSLNIFSWGAKMYMLYSHKRNVERESEKKWMETRVTMLEAELNDLDQDSPEYKKMQKVIDNYNTLIATTTKEIEEYRNS